ncbi:BQ5605_C033g11213 [Microbotryum silenes-dioicae]|uniref:BQ5605_C033g11213 protein n=1 Tax=Microbotryum silenes-dioicae TaxID=796604 RepID=A0A2X0PHC7_9BASI|nr:BQ5605_C033g11213 [Microbotryum silenes-dioicae]
MNMIRSATESELLHYHFYAAKLSELYALQKKVHRCPHDDERGHVDVEVV